MIFLALAAVLASQVPPERAAATFSVSDPELEWTLWASEPLFCNPTTIDIDHLGRVWVCEAVNYRCTLHGKPLNRPEGDRILILEDSKGQGRADKVTVFAQAPYIQSPLGIAVVKKPTGPGLKVYVCQSPDILVFEDKDGDSKADGPPKKLLSGFRGVDHDHGVHGITIGPDGKFYFSVGDSGVKELKSSGGKGRSWTTNKTDCQAGTIWRCDMDGTNLELIAHNFRNPYKPCIDSFGTIFVSDNDDDGNRETRICYVMPGGNYGYWPRGRGESHWHEDQPGVVPKILGTGFGSPTGMCVYEGTLLPKKYWGRVLHTDAGPRQLRAYTMKPQGAGYECQREDIVNSSDTWFRPSDICVAPDGSVFVADWYDPGVGGHGMGDLKMGRIYRLAPKGRKYVVPTMELVDFDQLPAALSSPCIAIRSMAIQTFMHMRGDEFSGDALPILAALDYSDDKRWLRARADWVASRLPEFKRSKVTAAGKAGGDPKEWSLDEWHSILRIRTEIDCYQLVAAMPKDLQTLNRRYSKVQNYLGLKRELVLSLRNDAPMAVADWLWELIKQYDGRDRFYLAAIGIAVGNDLKRREVILADFDKQFPEWNDKVADLVWELRPPVMMPKLVKMLGERKLTEQQRVKIVDILATQEAKFGDEFLRALIEDPSQMVQDRILMHFQNLLPGNWRELRQSVALMTTIEWLLSHRPRYPQALALIAAGQRNDFIHHVTAQTNDGSIDAVKTLGVLSTPEAISTLQTAIANLEQPFTFRAAAIQSMIRSRDGTAWLIENEDKIPDDLRIEASRLLRNSPYQDLRDKAKTAFPPPTKLDMSKLPDIAALAKMRGNVERGKAVLSASVKNDAACLKCHTVNREGGQIGPDLSAIGSKASRENLYESLLYPSRAISDQFAQWRIETRKGINLLGLIVEESTDEVLVRDANGKDIRIDKKAIDSREKSRNSLMPEDNAATLTMEELVDVVEYLMTLKAPAKPANR